MRIPARPTMADVAAAAGVGMGTVSRVVNGGVNVRESTRRRVEAVIERLGYRPSHLAAALSRGTPRTVAILVPYLTRPSSVARLAGALSVLDEQRYETIVCIVETPGQLDHHLTTLTARHRADGVIVVSVPLGEEHVAAFRRGSVPIVTVDTVVAGVPQTIARDVAGGRLATRHLLSLGHQRIGFIGDLISRQELPFTSSKLRLRGYRRELTAADIGFDPSLVRLGAHSAAAAAELTSQLLAMRDPPTAIFAASDTQAMGVLRAAERCGFAVPARLSVIGFDDIESSALLDLSTIHQPLEHSGAEGARRLCALLAGSRVRPLRQQLPLRLVKRASTGPPPCGPGGSRPHLLSAGAAGRARERSRTGPYAGRRPLDTRFSRHSSRHIEGCM
jgi:DNA-binding LacI/PurR family transcriptional regulator